MKKSLLLLTLLLLTGCTTHTAPSTYYTLSSKAPRQSPTHISKGIKIGMPNSTTQFITDSMRYTKSNGESGVYLYSAWSNPPIVMIGETLFSTLERSTLFDIVIPYSSLGQTDYLLESTLISFQHTIINTDTSESLIDISMRIIDLKTKKIIATKRFTIATPSKSNDAPGGVVALDQGLETLSTQTFEWLETVLKN